MSKLNFVSGNILQSTDECLVNPVNCVGVMGSGLAKQFKEKYPEMYKNYRKIISNNGLKIGSCHYYKLPNGQFIYNFPTKKRWADESTYYYIALGLPSITLFLYAQGLKSISIPKLGCGHGGLEFSLVKQIIIDWFEAYKDYANMDITYNVYEQDK